MPEDSISIGVDFDVDSGDLDAAVKSYARDVGREYEGLQDAAESVLSTIEDTVSPLQEMSDLLGASVDSMSELNDLLSSSAKEMSDIGIELSDSVKSMQEMSNLTGRVKDNLAAAGAAGAGGTAGGGTGGGAGGIWQALGPVGQTVAVGGAAALAGGAVASAVTSKSIGSVVWDYVAGAVDQWSRDVVRGGGMGMPVGPTALESRMAGQGPYAGFQALLAGESIGNVLGAATSVQQAGMAGGAYGLMRGMGGGPMGMFMGFTGGVLGGAAGEEMGGPLGAALGSHFMPGMMQSYRQEAMSRYPQYLATAASMAQVGLAGGDVRQMRGIRAARFGYGPAEQGQAFAGFLQGFGGGPATTGAMEQTMAYSRAYGVSMAEQGAAVGGLLRMGGNLAGSEAIREEALYRVMADAVSAGFGRQLPEYAQAVGANMQVALQGPALVGTDAMPGLMANMSRLTGQVAGRFGVGLEGAGRIIQPIAAMPQRLLGGLMGQGNMDPYTQAMFWTHNRERFGGSIYRMAEALSGAAADPMSAESLGFMQGPLEEIFRSSPSQDVQMLSIQRLFPQMSFQGVQQVMQRGGELMRSSGTLAGADLQELFTGISATTESEEEETRSAMWDIYDRGERMMDRQLRAMKSNAQFAESQFGISAAMARDASQFYRMQLKWSQIQVGIMQRVGLAQTIAAGVTALGSEELAEQIRGGTARGTIKALFTSIEQFVTQAGGRAEALGATQQRATVGRGEEEAVRELRRRGVGAGRGGGEESRGIGAGAIGELREQARGIAHPTITTVGHR